MALTDPCIGCEAGDFVVYLRGVPLCTDCLDMAIDWEKVSGWKRSYDARRDPDTYKFRARPT